MSGVVPPLALMGTVGGSGVPNRKRVPPVGNVAPVGAVHAAATGVVVDVTASSATVVVAFATFVPTAMAHVVCDPLPIGGRSALVSWRSSRPISTGLMSSFMFSSMLMIGLPTSS